MGGLSSKYGCKIGTIHKTKVLLDFLCPHKLHIHIQNIVPHQNRPNTFYIDFQQLAMAEQCLDRIHGCKKMKIIALKKFKLM